MDASGPAVSPGEGKEGHPDALGITSHRVSLGAKRPEVKGANAGGFPAGTDTVERARLLPEGAGSTSVSTAGTKRPASPQRGREEWERTQTGNVAGAVNGIPLKRLKPSEEQSGEMDWSCATCTYVLLFLLDALVLSRLSFWPHHARICCALLVVRFCVCLCANCPVCGAAAPPPRPPQTPPPTQPRSRTNRRSSSFSRCRYLNPPLFLCCGVCERQRNA